MQPFISTDTSPMSFPSLWDYVPFAKMIISSPGNIAIAVSALILFYFAVYSAIFTFHWIKYAVDTHRARRIMLVYFAGASSICILFLVSLYFYTQSLS